MADPLTTSRAPALPTFAPSSCPILAWVATLTTSERAALAARLGPEEPWEEDGAISSAPQPEDAKYAQRYIDRMKRRRGQAAADFEESPV